MHSRLLQDGSLKTYAVVLDSGEEVIEPRAVQA